MSGLLSSPAEAVSLAKLKRMVAEVLQHCATIRCYYPATSAAAQAAARIEAILTTKATDVAHDDAN